MSLFGAGLVLSQVQSPWEEAFAASAGSGHGTQPREFTCKQGAGHLALQVRVKQPPESRFRVSRQTQESEQFPVGFCLWLLTE